MVFSYGVGSPEGCATVLADGGHVTHRRTRTICVISAITLSVCIARVEAQRRVAGQAQPKIAIQASLTVGGQKYQSNEPGKCTHAEKGMIYQTVAELWSVQQSSDGRSLTLSLWKPKDGSADMITLSVSDGSSSHELNTVRGGGSTSGSATARMEKSGNGGIFTIDGRTKSGAPISGTIKCDAFAPHVAEGGL